MYSEMSLFCPLSAFLFLIGLSFNDHLTYLQLAALWNKAKDYESPPLNEITEIYVMIPQD